VSDIQLYDATLRDGMGGGGLSLTAEEKLRVVHALDALGVHMIEAGFPASNPKEQHLFELLAEQELHAAEVVAFGMTRRRDVEADADAGLRTLAGCFAPVCTLVGKTSVLHVEKVVRVSRAENLRMIADSVAYLKRSGREVIYDAEHFFDGYRADPDYALATLRAAAEAGADWVVLCDTNGGSLPDFVGGVVHAVREQRLPTRIGIHTHNDGELAVANTLAAIQAGAEQVQGTVNGYGERTGNANLCSIIPNLQLKLGYRCVDDDELRELTDLSHYVAEVANLAPDTHLPFVGASSFAHKAGLHVNAVLKNSRAYEHVVPELVGNRQRILMSELSGRSNVLVKAQQFGLALDEKSAAARQILETV
jgi:2-isopropylmalate synthase